MIRINQVRFKKFQQYEESPYGSVGGAHHDRQRRRLIGPYILIDQGVYSITRCGVRSQLPEVFGQKNTYRESLRISGATEILAAESFAKSPIAPSTSAETDLVVINHPALRRDEP